MAFDFHQTTIAAVEHCPIVGDGCAGPPKASMRISASIARSRALQRASSRAHDSATIGDFAGFAAHRVIVAPANGRAIVSNPQSCRCLPAAQIRSDEEAPWLKRFGRLMRQGCPVNFIDFVI